jgi:hypothetical protein
MPLLRGGVKQLKGMTALKVAFAEGSKSYKMRTEFLKKCDVLLLW